MRRSLIDEWSPRAASTHVRRRASRWTGLWLCAACVVSVTTQTSRASAQAAPPAQDPAAQRAEALGADLSGRRGDLTGIASAIALTDVLPDMRLDAQRALLNTLSKARLHPLAHTIVEVERARVAADGGDRAESQRIIAAAGFVDRWRLIGPFPNDGMSGMNTAFEPQQRLNIDVDAKGRHGAVSWRALDGRTRLGVVDASTLVRPVDGAVVYAATVIQSPRDQRAVLRVGASAAYTIWHNGDPVGRLEDSVGGAFDRDAHAVALKRGDNLVVLKLANEDGALTFSLRVTDDKGSPLRGVGATDDADLLRGDRALPPADDTAPDDATARPLTPTALFEARLQATPSAQAEPRAELLAMAARVHRFYRPGDPSEVHLAWLKEALALATTLDVLLSASDALAQPWARRAALEDAMVAQPKDPWLRYRHARMLLSTLGESHYVEAWRALEALHQTHPGFWAARALRMDVMLQEGLVESARHEARASLDAAAQHPRFLKAAANAAQAAQDPALQHAICEHRRRVNASHIGLYGPCAALLLRRGDAKGAVALIEDGLKARPDITGLMALKADVQNADEQLNDAAATLQALTALVPGEALYWQKLGMTRQRLGDDEAAAQALKVALSLDPLNAELADYLEQIAPRGPSLEETWALALPTLDAERERALYGDDDLITLIDQKVTRVYDNGLTSHFVQRAWRARTDPGVEQVRHVQIAYTPGEEAVEIVKAQVTRADGGVSKTYEVYEQSLSEPWYNLYYDYRAMVLVFQDLSPGDTLEVQYRINQTASQNVLGGYFGDVWHTQGASPRLISRYVLLTPPALSITAREPAQPHDKVEALVDKDGAQVLARSWTLSDVPAVELEPEQPGFSELADYLHLSTYATWEALATWYWALVKDQLVVDDDIRRIVADTTRGLTDRRQKVAALYNYVVKNTRYVGLEFGIHGFKPYRTTLCLRRRFGDCKDKASLIKVMLEEAGIPAHLVLVRTRNNGAIATTPPSLQVFDHAIAYVPEFDLFLDGTAEYSGSGELPWGDQGVQVVIVKDGGVPELRTTPIDPAKRNALLSSVAVDLRGQDATVDVSTTITGSFAAGYRQRYGTAESQRERFTERLTQDFNGAALDHLQFSALDDLEKPVRISYRFHGAELARKRARTLSFLPTLRDTRLAQRLAPYAKRTQDLDLGHPFVTQETYTVRLPAGFDFETPPQAQTLESPFGAFALGVDRREDGEGVTLELRVELRVEVHRVTAAQYPAFRAWLNDVDKVLGARLTAKLP